MPGHRKAKGSVRALVYRPRRKDTLRLLSFVKRRMKAGWTFGDVASSMLLVTGRTLRRWLAEDVPIAPAAMRYIVSYENKKRRARRVPR